MFEEYIAQGRNMIHRLEAHVGMSPDGRAALPAHQQVTVKEVVAWKAALEERIRGAFGPVVLARYHLAWDLYRDELDRDEGDEVTRSLNAWRRVVALLEELQ